jgi:2-iminobutanoate/2-iminopropanoate deaminase
MAGGRRDRRPVIDTGGPVMASSDAPAAQPRSWPPTRTAGGLIFVSGQLAMDDQGRLVGPGDWALQAERCLARIEQELADHGATMDDVVRLTSYLVDAAGFADYARVRAERYPGLRAAGTSVIVAGLLVEGALLEIEATARQPEAGAGDGQGGEP